MTNTQLLPEQQAVATGDLDIPTFLSGPYGTGKTTAGVARLHHLLGHGVAPEAILVLLPQLSLGQPYLTLLRTQRGLAPGQVKVQTLGGFARSMVDLFWPLIAEPAGFAAPNQPPTFLTLETGQFFLARAVQPLMEQEGYFSEVTLHPHRLYRQILDTLNKAAVVGFPHTELSARLNAAYEGDPAQRSVYLQAQECAIRFRETCLAHNLLDFSLTLETFLEHITTRPLFQAYRRQLVQHLIADNVEEDTPVSHDLLLDWLPDLSSALFLADSDGGYRTFLGADPVSARRIAEACPRKVQLQRSLVSSPDLQVLTAAFGRALGQPHPQPTGHPRSALVHHTTRFLPDLLDWTARETARLITEEGIPPGEIVILAPFLPDTLRFSLQQALDARGVPHRSQRPSRALREEPAARALLTLTRLAHPGWPLPPPTAFDLVDALSEAITGLDRMRASLLVDEAVLPASRTLLPFEDIPDAARTRIGYRLGERYAELREWLEDVGRQPQEELDGFFSLLFGEVLSQPGFGFHTTLDAARVSDQLIRSARAFRRTAGDLLRADGIDPGAEFVRLVDAGLLGGPYPLQGQEPEAVLLAPAFTFLMENQPASVQFWLSINSNAWWQRIYQPLTHPYVLSRQWGRSRIWTDNDEVFYGRQTLHHLTQGLLRRCRHRVYFGINEIGINGFEDRGPLMGALQQVLRDSAREGSDA